MSRRPLSTEIEAGVEYGSTTNIPVNNESDASNNSGRKPSVDISKERKVWFAALYFCFVIIFLAFFFVMALRYPLKPELYLTSFYIPALDKINPNITADKNFTYLSFKFVNRNKMISATYDLFNITIQYYLPNSTTRIDFGNSTTQVLLYQDNGKPLMVDNWTPISGMSGLRQQLKKELTETLFLVNLDFSMRFHCKEVGNHKHRFLMSTNIWISWGENHGIYGTAQMFEDYIRSPS